jgi:SNF2 family DNA or RNA helicase
VVKLYPHQTDALNVTADKNRVAYYHDMGLGKTYTGGEKMIQLGANINLVICQKSKIQDWVEHFKLNGRASDGALVDDVLDLTDKKQFELFISLLKVSCFPPTYMCVGVINYELAFRRPELTKLTDFTLMLDESSLIQNETAKRSKFILNKLKPANVILLSGTPTGGKYERLYSQLKLLGWNISKTTYWNTYIDYHFEDMGGFPVRFIDGYKNVDRLKRKMRELGCHFLKTDEVMELPDQIFTTVRVPVSKKYRKFRKDRVVEVDGTQLVGDNTLTAMLYERQLCAQYSKDKLEAFRDLVESTEDRLIVFYNFTAELIELINIVADLGKRQYSVVNGANKDLYYYENNDNSITFIQYQAGAMGLNLQKANKIIYYSPPLSSELYEQSKKRINRIGATKTSYYYNLTVTGSIEERIYKTLAMRKDFTEKLFEEADI